MSPPRDRREAEEYLRERLTAMLPRALEVLEEAVNSPNKRTAAKARKLLARHDAVLRVIARAEHDDLALRSTTEQEGARTRAAS
jgi:hypothetical protein